MNQDIRWEIGCHFSGTDPNVLKLPDFFNNDVIAKVKESFGRIFNDCPENGPSSTKTSEIFEAKIINFDFFQTFDI